MAMKPGAASDSWPEYSTTNMEEARMLLIPICEINSVCEFQNATGSVNSWIRKSICRPPPLDALAELGPEQALRAQHQHQEKRRKRDPRAHVAAEQHDRQHLDRAQQVAAENSAWDAAHATEHDHSQAAHLDAVSPDVRADVAQRDA